MYYSKINQSALGKRQNETISLPNQNVFYFDSFLKSVAFRSQSHSSHLFQKFKRVKLSNYHNKRLFIKPNMDKFNLNNDKNSPPIFSGKTSMTFYHYQKNIQEKSKINTLNNFD